MPPFSRALNALSKAIVHYDDGDVMRLANWIGLLEELREEVVEAHLPLVEEMASLIRLAIREGTPEGFLETLAQGLDELSRGGPAVDDSLWREHGPAFVSDARNRLARAQELVLALEKEASPEAVGELFRIVHTIKGEAGFLHQTELATRAHQLEELLDGLRTGNQTIDAILVDHLLGGVDELLGVLSPPEKPSEVAVTKGTEPTIREAPGEILRIPAGKIDALVSLVGELLVALESEAGEPSAVVKKLSRGLQQSALRLRTEPLKDLMGRIRRGARDLAKDLGKPVEVVTKGGDLELDRTLIASLEEPLMHLVRNSLDHGIEDPQGRRRHHKPSQGTLQIAAQRKGNRILLQVSDDGKGLDTEKIWTKAQERGLVVGDRPQDPASIHALIFQAGFSTAESLTQVSGRGVGMDVVATMVKAHRGRVTVETEEGRGTTFTLAFPLSTAVLEGLVVRVGPRRYVVPVNSAVETLRVTPEALTRVAQGSQVFSLRGQVFPVVTLQEALEGRPDESSPRWGVVVESGEADRRILLVDEVEAKKEVVIRALGPRFRHLRGVSAITILAGGTLALVLDVDQLFSAAEVSP